MLGCSYLGLVKINFDTIVGVNVVMVVAVCRNHKAAALIWIVAKVTLFAESMKDGGYTHFLMESDVLNVINPGLCSLVDHHWSIAYPCGCKECS